MRAPLRRASLSAMATACFRFRTLEPDEERRVLRLYSRITLLTLPRPRPPPLELRPLRLPLLLARRAITVTLSRALARRRRSCRQNRSALVSPPRAGGRPGMFSGASGGAACPPARV